jgi:hypothetical protein
MVGRPAVNGTDNRLLPKHGMASGKLLNDSIIDNEQMQLVQL